MNTLIRYLLLTALRDRLFIAIPVLILLATFAAIVFGKTGLAEEQQTALVLMAGMIRPILVAGMVLFGCYQIRRAFDTREIDVFLSRPLSRSQFVAAWLAGFLVLALCLILPALVVTALFAELHAGYVIWALSLTAELLIMGAMTLFCGLMLSSAVTASLTAFGFYLLARMIGFILAIVHSPVFDGEKWWMQAGAKIITAISTLLPRLDLFAQTAWLVHPEVLPADWLTICLQSLVFIPFLLAVILFDFRRREF